MYLSGFGDYQFNEHPCVVQSFQYNLPADVDYIRCLSSNQAGLNLSNLRPRQSVASNSIFATIQRLSNTFSKPNKGAMPSKMPVPNLGLNSPTYVPTKIELSITLLPVVSRKRQVQEFSVKEYANGNLLRGGFW